MKTFNKILGIAGIVLLVWVLYKYGFIDIIKNIVSLRFKLVLVLVPSTILIFIYSFAWLKILNHYVENNNYWSLLRIKLIGESFNVLTPLGFVGGDSIKFIQLKAHVPAMDSASSVIIDRATNIFSGIILIFIASFVLGIKYNIIPIYLEIIIPILIFVTIFVYTFLLFVGKTTFFDKLKKFFIKINIKKDFFIKIIEKLEKVSNSIATFFAQKKKTFFQVLSIHLLGRFLGVLEIWIIVFVLGLGNQLELAFIMAGMTSLFIMIFYAVPGQVGVLEELYGRMFAQIGIDPAVGVSVQILRRIRVIFWIIIGLILLNLGKKGKVDKDLAEIKQSN